MKIFINGRSADITLDTEKTLGDVLSGMEQWISAGGNRMQKISVDGTEIPGENLGAVFGRDINEIRTLEITAASFRELAAETLFVLKNLSGLFTEASLEERSNIIASWEKSPASGFLSSEIPDIDKLARDFFAGTGLTPGDLGLILEERLAEIADPLSVIIGAEALVNTVSKRMEELPLDMQTGKDRKAAETIQLFSNIGEKLFRLLQILKAEGLSMDNFTVENQSSRCFMDEFNHALKEISGAYTKADTVLAGDIAEYELAPRLLKLYDALRVYAQRDMPII